MLSQEISSTSRLIVGLVLARAANSYGFFLFLSDVLFLF